MKIKTNSSEVQQAGKTYGGQARDNAKWHFKKEKFLANQALRMSWRNNWGLKSQNERNWIQQKLREEHAANRQSAGSTDESHPQCRLEGSS